METPTPQTSLDEFRSLINELFDNDEAEYTKLSRASSDDLTNNLITPDQHRKITSELIEYTSKNREKGANIEALIFLNRKVIKI
jgi:hypothetical protein